MMKVNDTRYEVLRIALVRLFDRRSIEITEIDERVDKGVQFGVNWAARGTKTINETKEFVNNMRKAVEIAEYLNSLGMVVAYLEYTDDSFDFKNAVEGMIYCLDAFDDFDRYAIKKFLEDDEVIDRK